MKELILRVINVFIHNLSLMGKVTIVSIVAIISIGVVVFAIQPDSNSVTNLNTTKSKKETVKNQTSDLKDGASTIKDETSITSTDPSRDVPVNNDTTPTNSIPAPAPTPTAPTPTYIPLTLKCNQELADSYANLRDVYLNAENITYTNNLQAIKNEASAEGMLFSGRFDAMRPPEDARHDVRVQEINTQYAVNMIATNC